MMDTKLAQAVKALSAGLQEERRTNSVDLAATAILVFDWLLLLNTEYDLVWKAEWRLSKALYILVRYLPFFDTLLVLLRHHVFTMSATVCQGVFRAIVVSSAVGVLSAELILTLRTWAVMGKGRKLTWAIFGFYASMAIANATIAILYAAKVQQGPSPAPQLIGCTLIYSANRLLAVMYVFFIIYDGALLASMAILAISACVSIFLDREQNSALIGGMSVVVRSLGTSELMRVVYRDGIMYYFYLFILSLLNLFVILFFPPGYELMLLVLERVTHSIVACRVVLHIRIVGTRPVIPVELIPLEGSTSDQSNIWQQLRN